MYSIGELARRTGLTVKAVRRYSDRGLLPSVRTAAGHRRYGVEALARLDLVRTLRDLGLDLATISRVVDGETSLPDVAAAHAEALRVQIRVLRLRRAVLTAVAKRGSTPGETSLVHKLAKLSADERRALVADFLGATFDDRPGFGGIARTLTPELPDDPDVEQVEAWVELAELAQDPGFRALMRRLAERHPPGLRRDRAAEIRDAVAPAVERGVEPGSPEAAEIVGRLGPGPDQSWLDAVADPRRQRYLELLAVINGWAAPESPAPALGWFSAARAHAC